MQVICYVYYYEQLTKWIHFVFYFPVYIFVLHMHGTRGQTRATSCFFSKFQLMMEKSKYGMELVLVLGLIFMLIFIPAAVEEGQEHGSLMTYIVHVKKPREWRSSLFNPHKNCITGHLLIPATNLQQGPNGFAVNPTWEYSFTAHNSHSSFLGLGQGPDCGTIPTLTKVFGFIDIGNYLLHQHFCWSDPL